MKKRWFLYFVLVILILSGCSSKPSITGRWEVTGWEFDLIEFTADQKFFKYQFDGNKENPKAIDNGHVSFINQSDQNCFLLSSQILMEGSWGLKQTYSYEMIN